MTSLFVVCPERRFSLCSADTQLEQLQTQASELKKQQSELARLGAGELIKVSQELLEQKNRNEDTMGVVTQLENMVEMYKQETETLR